MDSFQETVRQLRFSLVALAILFPLGVFGYMLIEGLSFMDSIWITIITLGTIGYGDLVPQTDAGRVFTVFLVVFGLGAVAYAAQAFVVILVSPDLRRIRQRRKVVHRIRRLRNHYVIFGTGEMVDHVMTFIQQWAELRRQYQRLDLDKQVDRRLRRILGNGTGGPRALLKRIIRVPMRRIKYLLHRGETILDVMVVVTSDLAYAETLRTSGVMVVEAKPTDDDALSQAGIERAKSAVSLLEGDTETILNVLTIRNHSPQINITATTQDDSMAMKIIRVGANSVLPVYEIAGQFLNNATLRPVVNDFFNGILFDRYAHSRIVQLYIDEDSHWVGQTLGDLALDERFQTGVIGIRTQGGSFLYTPGDDYQLLEEDVVLTITPGPRIRALVADSNRGSGFAAPPPPLWQRLPTPTHQRTGSRSYSLIQAEDAIGQMSKHYIICGTDAVARNSLKHLDPDRPFVFVSNDNEITAELLKRGFRVIHGDPKEERTLYRAGVDRALALMVTVDHDASAILTVLNSRSINRSLLIVAAANSDDMLAKLRRAGADRVISPSRIAAQFVLLATTRPIVADFLQHVLYNERANIETTELYMQDDSPWIGQSLNDLDLWNRYRAGVVGIRQNDGHFVYVPSPSYTVSKSEVLVVVMPMAQSETLRDEAHASADNRPRSLRAKLNANANRL